MDEGEFNELLKKLTERAPTLAGSAVAFLSGIGLLLDDAHDFGKMGEDRGYPHHWFIGVLAMLGGLAGLGFALLDLLSKTPPATPIKLPPPSLLEQGATPEEIERLQKMLETK